MENDITRRKRAFIIIEPDPIVSLDLIGIFETAFPDAELTLFQTEAEAQMHLALASPAVSVVVSSRVVSPSLLQTLRDCAARQSQVMIIGSARDLDFHAIVVDTPFTSEMVLSSLKGAAP